MTLVSSLSSTKRGVRMTLVYCDCGGGAIVRCPGVLKPGLVRAEAVASPNNNNSAMGASGQAAAAAFALCLYYHYRARAAWEAGK
jgi:hypothetical protein